MGECLNRIWRRGRALGLAAVLAVAGVLPAQAVIVSIGGTDYDVLIVIGPTTYFDNRDEIVLSPWWGNAALAEEAANNFHTATGGDYGISAGIGDFAVFAYDETGSLPGDDFTMYRVQENVGTAFGPQTNSSSAPVGNIAGFAYVIPAAVPEIDGNALAKALFILFALGAWLDVRRRRAA